MSSLIFFLLLLCISDSESVKTLRNLAVKRGGSLTIPCFYNKQYKSNRKYWCKGEHWLSCQIVAYTNTSKEISVTDHPAQNMFIVELNSLQDSDSGYYWCAVEIGGRGTPDDKDYLYLTVSADPAVSVKNSSVSGQEGGSVSVQCSYSVGYKNKQKKWCRFKDWSCYEVGRTNSSQNSTVLVSDYGTESTSVKMSGLQKSDAGWYWFSAGDVGVTVHLTVTDSTSTTWETSIRQATSGSTTVAKITKTTTADRTSTNAENVHRTSNNGKKQDKGTSPSASENGHDSSHSGTNQDDNGNTRLIWVLLGVSLGLLLILVSVTTWLLRKKSKRNQAVTRRSVNSTAVHLTSENSVIYSAVNRRKTPTPENSVIYSDVNRKKPSSASEDVNDVIYNNVIAAKKTPSQAAGDDGLIYNSLVFN